MVVFCHPVPLQVRGLADAHGQVGAALGQARQREGGDQHVQDGQLSDNCGEESQSLEMLTVEGRRL